MDYGYKEKEKARRVIWREIAKRCKQQQIDPRRARVLYMPGDNVPHDRDRNEAKRFGFRPWNMVGVDYCLKVAKRWRRETGANVIAAQAESVLYWSRDYFDVVYLDFCGPPTIELSRAVVGATPSIMAFNFMRGREQGIANSSRKQLINGAFTGEVKYMVKGQAVTCDGAVPAEWRLHRGWQAYQKVVMLLNGMVDAVAENEPYMNLLGCEERPRGITEIRAIRRRIRDQVLPPGYSAQGTYRSNAKRDGGLLFDWIIWNRGQFRMGGFDDAFDSADRRKLAAAKAVATMQRSKR